MRLLSSLGREISDLKVVNGVVKQLSRPDPPLALMLTLFFLRDNVLVQRRKFFGERKNQAVIDRRDVQICRM